jgi:hypothetical protein
VPEGPSTCACREREDTGDIAVLGKIGDFRCDAQKPMRMTQIALRYTPINKKNLDLKLSKRKILHCVYE